MTKLANLSRNVKVTAGVVVQLAVARRNVCVVGEQRRSHSHRFRGPSGLLQTSSLRPVPTAGAASAPAPSPPAAFELRLLATAGEPFSHFPFTYRLFDVNSFIVLSVCLSSSVYFVFVRYFVYCTMLRVCYVCILIH